MFPCVSPLAQRDTCHVSFLGDGKDGKLTFGKPDLEKYPCIRASEDVDVDTVPGEDWTKNGLKQTC